MKKIILSLSFLCLFANLANAKMTISSPDFKEGKMISNLNVYNGFGCSGNNIFPHIEIENLPQGTESLAITVYDPDAPTGSGWWHWIVYDIPVSIMNQTLKNIKISKIQDFKGKALFGRNDFGTFDYGGPCPPVGHSAHRYILTVYALKVPTISVLGGSSAALIGYNINANVIEKSSITSIYQR